MSKIENSIEGAFLSKMWIQIVKYRKYYQHSYFLLPILEKRGEGGAQEVVCGI